jgi:hypothetical protein
MNYFVFAINILISDFFAADEGTHIIEKFQIKIEGACLNDKNFVTIDDEIRFKAALDATKIERIREKSRDNFSYK